MPPRRTSSQNCQGSKKLVMNSSVSPCLRGEVLLLIYRRHALEHFSSPRTFPHGIVVADLAVAKHYDALGKLRHIRLVRDQDDRQPAVVQLLEDLHDLDRGAAIQIARGLIS